MKDASSFAKLLYEEGFAEHDARKLRKNVGCYYGLWKKYEIGGNASKWNLASLYVLAYLKWRGAAEEAPAPPPPVWDLFGTPQPGVWSTVDLHDALRAITSRWRVTEMPMTPTHKFYIRSLEQVAATLIDVPCEKGTLEDICNIFAVLWAMEFFQSAFLSGAQPHPDDVDTLFDQRDEDVTDHTEEPPDSTAWLSSEQEAAKRAKRTGAMTKQYGVVLMYPAESQQYARDHGGIEANNPVNVFEFTRTHVQARSAEAFASKLDVENANGVLTALLVDRCMQTQLRFPWFKLVVKIDTKLLNFKKLTYLEARFVPWILLFGGTWYVIHRKRVFRCVNGCTSAISLWFDLIKQRCGSAFEYLEHDFGLTSFYEDPQFPFARP